MKCTSDNLCNKAKYKYKVETGVCPDASICSYCGIILSCDDPKYVVPGKIVCVSCIEKHRMEETK